MINFKTTKEEGATIQKIAKRAVKLFKRHNGWKAVRVLDFEMDVTACHMNGCKIDLERLLNAPDFDFMHDIAGIANHINRKTGKIEGHFLPRTAKGN